MLLVTKNYCRVEPYGCKYLELPSDENGRVNAAMNDGVFASATHSSACESLQFIIVERECNRLTEKFHGND